MGVNVGDRVGEKVHLQLKGHTVKRLPLTCGSHSAKNIDWPYCSISCEHSLLSVRSQKIDGDNVGLLCVGMLEGIVVGNADGTMVG